MIALDTAMSIFFNGDIKQLLLYYSVRICYSKINLKNRKPVNYA